jgi:hypothetical protein
LLGGAASAAILTAGVLCGLSLPVSGLAAAANVIGASCGTSSSSTTGSNMIQANGPMQASAPASTGVSSDGSSNSGSITTPLSGVNGG